MANENVYTTTRRLVSGRRPLGWVVAGLMLVAALVAGCVPDAPTPQSTAWDFTIAVRYSTAMVSSHGGEAGLQTLIRSQLATVESRFAGFDKPIHFMPTSFTSYAGAPNDHVATAHPGADLLLVYTEDTSIGGGWFGSNQAILHDFYTESAGVKTPATFSSNATDGLTHEFGHFRGAIDMYAQNVAAASNPVSHTSYQSVTSIMDYPYGNVVWDDYTRCIINRSAGVVGSEVPVVATTLPPTYQVVVTSPSGAAVSGASVTLYPVAWYSNAVTATAAVSGATTASGVFELPSDPFQPLANHSSPWATAASNFLIKVQKGSSVNHAWLPISVAGLADCTLHGEPLVLPVTLA